MRELARVSAVLLLVNLCATTAGAGVFAGYRDDFRPDAPLVAGWQYLWNAPSGWRTASQDDSTGSIGDPSYYVALQDAGSLWTPDGDTTYNNNPPAGYCMLTSTGGHPGQGAATIVDRGPVAAYTIQPGDLPGDHGPVILTNSFAKKSSPSGDSGLDVVVHVNDGPATRTLIPNASSGTFNAYLGDFSVGDTVYVAVGPDNSSQYDTFTLDFSLSNQIVANYRDDFRSDAPLAPGWQYLWNAPDGFGTLAQDDSTGLITELSSLLPLVDAGTMWTGDGNTNGADPGPDGYIRLHSTGGHPGRPLEGVDRYAIAAYTVPVAAPYAIRDSFLFRPSSAGNGNEVRVFVDPMSPLVNTVIPAGATGSFDVFIGDLEAGDTIYVACGTNMNSGSDSFAWDFSVVVTPEPATMLLLAPAVLALARRRRRS